ncbi:MAG TPA: hypothetical protein VK502_01155 [Candidatus Saccharimonadales bacterium]|nr:hypothetical protein [Candidatus Saccharimonadales bacterium]
MGFMIYRGKEDDGQRIGVAAAGSAFGYTDAYLRPRAATQVRNMRRDPASQQRIQIAEMQRQQLFPSDVTDEHRADFFKLDVFLNPQTGTQSYL